MTSNVETLDRAISLPSGIAWASLELARIVSGGLAIAAYCVGGIALLTGALDFCPAWSLFGISTCPLKPTASDEKLSHK